MGAYGAILEKHGVSVGPATKTTDATSSTDAVSGALGRLVLHGHGGSGIANGKNDATPGDGGSLGHAAAAAAVPSSYQGNLHELAPAALAPAVTETTTKFRGYDVDADAMRRRMRQRHAARGGVDGT